MKNIVWLFFVLLFVIACDKPKNEPNNNFDRKEMLENYTQNLVKPAYQDLQIQVNTLKTASDNFNQNTNAPNLIALQNAWVSAYKAWQFASAYNFGPAGEQGLQKRLIEEIATFPASSSKIESSISVGNANFNDFNRDSRGFLALEYLIFSLTDDNAVILSSFIATNRRNYLVGATNHLKNSIDAIVVAWDSFQTTFVADAGTSAGSSTSLLYNEFVRSFESLKNFKLGLPLGKRPGQTQTEPQLVEAYYSGRSLEMMQIHLKALENIWYGKDKNSNDGIGFKENLANVSGGEDLIVATENQLNAVRVSLGAIPSTPRLSIQIQASPANLEQLHTELQKQTRFFKSDMSSLLGISITFSSGDGD